MVTRIAEHLQERFPGIIAEQDEITLRGLIHHGLAKAETYSITDEYDVRRYVEYMILYGTAFDTDPQMLWVRKFLCDTDLTGREKMDRIDDYDTFILNEE